MSRYNHGNNGFDFGDFEITKREILASVSIIAVMLLIGVLISSKISEHQLDASEVYNKAVKIDNTDLFRYSMDTNVGNAFVRDVRSVDFFLIQRKEDCAFSYGKSRTNQIRKPA